MRKHAVVCLVLAGVVCLTVSRAEGQEAKVLFRLTKAGFHRLAIEPSEIDALKSSGWKVEGPLGWIFTSPVPGSEPLYHVQKQDDNVYTTRLQEALDDKGYGFSDPDRFAYVASNREQDTVPLYRLYNSKYGIHIYITNEDERQTALNSKAYEADSANPSGQEGFVWTIAKSFPKSIVAPPLPVPTKKHVDPIPTPTPSPAPIPVPPVVWWSVGGVTAIAALIAALASMISAVRKRKD